MPEPALVPALELVAAAVLVALVVLAAAVLAAGTVLHLVKLGFDYSSPSSRTLLRLW